MASGRNVVQAIDDLAAWSAYRSVWGRKEKSAINWPAEIARIAGANVKPLVLEATASIKNFPTLWEYVFDKQFAEYDEYKGHGVKAEGIDIGYGKLLLRTGLYSVPAHAVKMIMAKNNEFEEVIGYAFALKEKKKVPSQYYYYSLDSMLQGLQELPSANRPERSILDHLLKQKELVCSIVQHQYCQEALLQASRLVPFPQMYFAVIDPVMRRLPSYVDHAELRPGLFIDSGCNLQSQQVSIILTPDGLFQYRVTLSDCVRTANGKIKKLGKLSDDERHLRGTDVTTQDETQVARVADLASRNPVLLSESKMMITIRQVESILERPAKKPRARKKKSKADSE